MKNKIQLFEEKKVRTVWDDETVEWYFSVVDVVEILTDQPSHQGARNYWKVLKIRLLKEGNETVTNCNRLKLEAEDGKLRPRSSKRPRFEAVFCCVPQLLRNVVKGYSVPFYQASFAS